MLYVFIALLAVASIYCVMSEEQSLEAKVTSKMKHLMEEFSKDGNSHPMSDVLVFVHSNYDAPVSQVKMYFKMMHGVFPRMIFFGEWDHEKVHELHQMGLPVFKCPHNSHGTLAQVIMLKALEHFQHPYFKGYMYIHDDMLISPKTIINLDKSKLWISNQMERTVLEPWNSRSFRWVHFNQGGIDSMQRIYNDYPEMEAIVDKCTDSKATGVPVKGTSHTLYNGHSDFFYLPVSLIPAYQKYMTVFVDKGVFLEIAVAMWAKCFTPNFDTEAIELVICTTWDYSVRSDIWKWGPHCEANTSLIHPVKYSNPSALKFAQEFLIKHKTKYSNTNFTIN